MRSVTAPILLVTLAAAAGCSSTDEQASAAAAAASNAWNAVPAPVSGTRLRARFVTGGGARELVGFRDSLRNEDCTFQPAEPGATRCLPATLTANIGGGGFSDAACTIPLASVPACSPDTKYAIVYRFDAGTCSGRPNAAEIRNVVASSSRYVMGTGGCTPSPPAALAGSAALGDVLSWADFVSAVETIVPGDPIAEKVLIAADGARQHLGFRIQKLDVDCMFQLMPDGITRCVPDGPGGAVMYTDSACTKPSFVNDYASGPCVKAAGKLWLEPSIGTCGGARAVYSLSESRGGDVAPYDDLYTPSISGSGSGSASVTCTSRGGGGASSSPARRGIDADLTSSLPTAARVGGGDGRLVPALVATSATAVIPTPSALALGWHDNERDVDCTFTLATDGKLRCLPTGPAATVFFTDTTCSSPSRVAVLGEVPCAGTGRFGRVATPTCPVTTRVYALGTERRNLTSASTETSPGRCPTFPGVTNALDATEVDPAGFVEGLPVTE